MRAGSYSGSQHAHSNVRGTTQFPSQSSQRSLGRSAMRASATGNVKASAPSYGQQASYPMFESQHVRAPFGGSLDGGSMGGSVDGDSVSGYSWAEQPGMSGVGLCGGTPQSYTVVKAIGGGGAGEAYIVTGKADGKRYVAKQIVCLGDQYKAAAASYAMQETRLLFLLQHPHICGLVDFYPKSANFFIVLEYCEQGDLGRHISGAIRRGNIKFDAERVYTWWYQILDAIEFCHSKSVLHRDLKPKNIFIDAKLNVKVGDFGVSALVSSPPAVERVGTLTYHSPEVQSSLQYSVKSDVWAIGVIIWETMLLRPPGGEPVRLAMVNFSNIVPTYGQACRDLLALHLADHPDHRETAGALKEAMLQRLQESTRQTVASRAYMSSVTAQSDAEKHVERMRPRTIQVPDMHGNNMENQAQGSEDPFEMRPTRSNWDGASSDSYSGRDGGSVTSSDRSFATTAPQVQDWPPPKEALPEVLELSSELGIHVSAGTGGELGAWKIAMLLAHKPAAKSKAIAVGEYLWEINGKVVFGMPFQLISSLVKGKASEVKIGVKTGLGLSIRHAVIRLDGDDGGPGNVEAAPLKESLPSTADSMEPASTDNTADVAPPVRTADIAPAVPTAEAEHVQAFEYPFNESPRKQASPESTAADSLPVVASEADIQEEDAEKLATITEQQWNAMDDAALKLKAVPQRSPALPGTPPPPPLSQSPTLPDDQFGAQSPTPPVDQVSVSGSDAPALVLEPKGIRAINSPIMQSPLSIPKEPAAAHVPTDMDSGLHGDASVSGALILDASALKPTTQVRTTARGQATIAGDGQYDGELCDGKPFGMGTATWPHQGHTYVGEWRDGVMHGHGTATYLNGDRYDGEWSNGKRSGLGRYAHGSGDIYEGLWSNERKHGLGVDSFADGRGYRGEFLENKFAGVGAYFTVDGAVYQGDWFQGKAHGSGISTSTNGGQPAYVQYSHGNLTRSEPLDSHEYEAKQARVEKLSHAAVAIALLARRVASLIRAKKLDPPMQYMEELEGQALRECLPSISGTSLLGKALVLLAGVHTIVQEDSSLVVTTVEESTKIAGAPPAAAAPGDIVCEVASRSGSWYKGMSLEEIMSHLQSQRLEVGLKSEGMPPWAKPDIFEWPMRRPGFVV